jgi:hypothetical protein
LRRAAGGRITSEPETDANTKMEGTPRLGITRGLGIRGPTFFGAVDKEDSNPGDEKSINNKP